MKELVACGLCRLLHTVRMFCVMGSAGSDDLCCWFGVRLIRSLSSLSHCSARSYGTATVVCMGDAPQQRHVYPFFIMYHIIFFLKTAASSNSLLGRGESNIANPNIMQMHVFMYALMVFVSGVADVKQKNLQRKE